MIKLNIKLLLQREYYFGILKQWIGNAKESLDSLQGESYYVIWLFPEQRRYHIVIMWAMSHCYYVSNAIN